MRINKTTFTVALPTYYGAPAIIDAVKSIRASEGVDEFRLIVAVDGNQLKPEIQKKLEALGAEIHLAEKRGGQTARINQIISLCETEILILTQDDVIFHQDTIKNILKMYEMSHPTMIAPKIVPAQSQTFFENVLETGVRINYDIGSQWNNADNYLLAIGRCLVFKTDHVKQFEIADSIINSDAYLYFENKRLGGTFKYAQDAIVTNKSPQKLAEHTKQSIRFQQSKDELANYQKMHVDQEYLIPIGNRVSAAFKEFIAHPVLMLTYTFLKLYTKIKYLQAPPINKPYWETDVSTKR